MKDLTLGETLFKGQVKFGVYEYQSFRPQVFASTLNPLDCHHRLGHPSFKFFRQLVSRFQVNVRSISTSDCNSCACNKSHKLPFSISTITSTSPLQYVYIDLCMAPRIFS